MKSFIKSMFLTFCIIGGGSLSVSMFCLSSCSFAQQLTNKCSVSIAGSGGTQTFCATCDSLTVAELVTTPAAKKAAKRKSN